ncbi:MAG: hypothetical protein JO354_00320, partial [Verrucomicrobia bacterium]|nr:hypothetical protein [Verrucomicrobiota bacterium]
MPVIRALRSEFDDVRVLANRPFAALTTGSDLVLDDPRLAPFFIAVAPRDLPQKYREYFGQHDLVIAYVHDPLNHFETNVRACGVSTVVRGP